MENSRNVLFRMTDFIRRQTIPIISQFFCFFSSLSRARLVMLHFRDCAQLCSLGALCFKYYSFPGASKICTLYLCYFKRFQLIASCSSIKVISWLLIAVSVFSCVWAYHCYHLLKSRIMHIQDWCRGAINVNNMWVRGFERTLYHFKMHVTIFEPFM